MQVLHIVNLGSRKKCNAKSECLMILLNQRNSQIGLAFLIFGLMTLFSGGRDQFSEDGLSICDKIVLPVL